MTLRSIILGLCGAIFICGVTYFNDAIIGQSYLIGNYMPASIYGGLIIFILLINPLLFYLSKRWGFSSKEMVVVITLILASCCVPAAGLMRILPAATVFPHQHYRTEVSWQEEQVLDLVPGEMMVDTSPGEKEVLDGFTKGLKSRDEHIPFSKIPWAGWTRTLLFWLPIVLTLWIALIGLSLVVHRQWSDHEHLAYPIATFTNSLLPAEGQTKSSIFSNKLFWLGAGIIFAIYLNNYLYAWFPQAWFKIPTGFNLRPFGDLWENFSKVGGRTLLKKDFYFTFVGIAYLLAADVSFSIGIAPFLWHLVYLFFINFGIVLGQSVEGIGVFFGLRMKTFLLGGAYLGLAMGIFYTGRRFYLRVFRRALFMRTPGQDQPEPQAVWGARIFLAFIAIFFLQILLVGLDWPLALLYTGLTVVTFLGISRILAETGLFWIQTWFTPGVIIWGVFGLQALGPRVLIIMSLLSIVILMDPRETIMPYIVNSFKLLDLQKVKPGKTAVWCLVAVILGLTIALPVTFYLQYDHGYIKTEKITLLDWAHWYTSDAFGNAAWMSQKLKGQNMLEQANQVSGWQRFTHMMPNWRCLISLMAGVFLVLLFVYLRLRWPKWPLHPIIFLVWGTWAGNMIWASFFLGWLIKVATTKYGGVKLYQYLKPLMIGLIAGEICAALLCSLIGFIYYFATGLTPANFSIFP